MTDMKSPVFSSFKNYVLATPHKAVPGFALLGHKKIPLLCEVSQAVSGIQFCSRNSVSANEI